MPTVRIILDKLVYVTSVIVGFYWLIKNVIVSIIVPKKSFLLQIIYQSIIKHKKCLHSYHSIV